MNMLNQFVTQLATFIGETPSAKTIAWVVTVILILFALLLLRWLFNWFTRANEIVANQEHIIEMLESRSMAGASARQSSVTPNLNMRPVASLPPEMAANASAPVRQHPIDDEFSEILNVRPHNMQSQMMQRPQPVPSVVSPVPPSQAPVQPASGLRPSTLPSTAPQPIPAAPVAAAPVVSAPTAAAPTAAAPVQVLQEAAPAPVIQPQPTQTSVTMLGSPEARAERQLEAREAMRLAEQAANSTLSKTADIPDIPTALVRTYSASKTNPLTGKRVADRAPLSDDDQDAVPNQFQLRDS